ISLSTSSPVYGQSVTATATVTAVNPLTLKPSSGTVTFWQGAVTTATNHATTKITSGGTATFTLSNLPIESRSYNVSYAGGSNFLGSSSTSLATTPVPSTTLYRSISLSTSSPVYGQSVTATATVTAVSPSTLKPSSGTVTFW